MSGWDHVRVTACGTHHVRGNEPLYAARFDQVLAFHAPGLAPVCRCGEAWHVDVDGRAAYARRFEQAFGFYEGLAAVVSGDGWHHILGDGTDLYAERYGWCGNYQGERCAVRAFDGRYRHLDARGRPAYAESWHYAGDFRDGAAVVQGADGCSTHIGPDGGILHGHWYLDLDVFHKGFARARDEEGWMHVDICGRPIYPRRFAMVEPFYNGQARVERMDGGLEVIVPDGRTLVVLRERRTP